ncbi:hypothetical protein [Neisseria cinerea]|uniref:Uncharacterized protein n=1 Tax=Neisseria cinerea TaxID=483 RepID=A0A7T3BN21_NEICI|nr:hypothetical protein [Neisseria cinerea]QPT37563.1 hypothetical protein I6G28_06420 [Neisseria cinerea]
MPSESPLLSDGISKLPAQPATVQKAEQKPSQTKIKETERESGRTQTVNKTPRDTQTSDACLPILSKSDC